MVADGEMAPPVLVFVQARDTREIRARYTRDTRETRPSARLCPQSKERAIELFRALVYDGLRVDVIHADRTQARALTSRLMCILLRILLCIVV